MKVNGNNVVKCSIALSYRLSFRSSFITKALYVTESGAKNALTKKKDAVRVPMAPNIDRQFSRHNISFFRGALKTSEDDAGSFVSEVAMLSRKDSGINNTNAFSTSFHENKLGLGLSPLPSMDTFRLGRKSTMNLESTGSEYNLDEEKAVPAGLIDYCVILGKRLVVLPSHCDDASSPMGCGSML